MRVDDLTPEERADLRPARARQPVARPELPWRSGLLPLTFRVQVPADAVILNVSISGKPTPWERPAFNPRTRTWFTPPRTKQAERDLQVVMRNASRLTAPTSWPVGVFAVFRVAPSQRPDADNLLKTVLDALQGVIVVNDKQVAETHVHRADNQPNPGTDLLVWIRPPADTPR